MRLLSVRRHASWAGVHGGVRRASTAGVHGGRPASAAGSGGRPAGFGVIVSCAAPALAAHGGLPCRASGPAMRALLIASCAEGRLPRPGAWRQASRGARCAGRAHEVITGPTCELAPGAPRRRERQVAYDRAVAAAVRRPFPCPPNPPRSPRRTAPTPVGRCARTTPGTNAQARGLGPPPPRLREADLHRPPRPPRHHAGRRSTPPTRPRRTRSPSRVRPEFVDRGRGRGRAAPARDQENAKLADGRRRAPGPHGHDPQRGEDAAVLRQRPGRDDRREPAPQVPLPRHPPRGRCSAACCCAAASSRRSARSTTPTGSSRSRRPT